VSWCPLSRTTWKQFPEQLGNSFSLSTQPFNLGFYMITINNLTKAYGEKTLFKDISLNINRGEKIGLIGPNGAGKSTLFHLLLGEAEPSAGAIQVQKNIRVGYLPQESSFQSALTVLQELTQGDEIIMRFQKEKHEL